MLNWGRRTRPQSEYLKNMVEHDNFIASLDEIESKLEVGRTQSNTIVISKHLSHDQIQQIRGQLLNLEKKLNEHLDTSKARARY